MAIKANKKICCMFLCVLMCVCVCFPMTAWQLTNLLFVYVSFYSENCVSLYNMLYILVYFVNLPIFKSFLTYFTSEFYLAVYQYYMLLLHIILVFF